MTAAQLHTHILVAGAGNALLDAQRGDTSHTFRVPGQGLPACARDQVPNLEALVSGVGYALPAAQRSEAMTTFV